MVAMTHSGKWRRSGRVSSDAALSSATARMLTPIGRPRSLARGRTGLLDVRYYVVRTMRNNPPVRNRRRSLSQRSLVDAEGSCPIGGQDHWPLGPCAFTGLDLHSP